MKTDIDIQKWVCCKILGTELHESVSGTLSDRGRPNGSEDEDIIVAVLANNGAGQIQTAYVNVNIYVKDQWNRERNAWERNTARIAELCNMSLFLFNLSENCFLVSDVDSSQRVIPAGITFQDGHTEHIINNKLFIKICNN